MRVTILFLLLGLLCFARDNPFEPVENIAKFTQVAKEDKHFKRADFSLPDSARILKKIDVYYQNLDGSVSRKVVDIDRKIDWHDKFILVYKKDLNKKRVVNEAGSYISKKSLKKVDKKLIRSFSYKNFISFRVGKKRLEIFTRDSKIRDFMVDKPYKIVVDFKRDTNFLTKTFKLNLPPFVSVVLGNHEGYYRAAIELDGQYIYNIKRKKGEYIITLR